MDVERRFRIASAPDSKAIRRLPRALTACVSSRRLPKPAAVFGGCRLRGIAVLRLPQRPVSLNLRAECRVWRPDGVSMGEAANWAGRVLRAEGRESAS